MELDYFLLIIAVISGAYVVVFGFIKKLNEWYHVSRVSEKDHPLPPGDMGWPVVGNMQSFYKAYKSNNPESFVNDMVRRCGRTGIYKAHMFGSPSVIVCDPQTCRRVLMDDESFGPGQPPSTKKLFERESVNPEAEHRLVRRLAAIPVNGSEASLLYIKYIEDLAVAAMEEWASMDRPIELLSEVRRFAFKAIAYIFLGPTNDSVLGPLKRSYNDLLIGLNSIGINLPGFAFHKALEARRNLEKMLGAVLEERRAMSNRSHLTKGMMDLMMEFEDEDGRKLGDEEIIYMLLALLFAGHETVAHATMWAALYLYQHPEILQKAQEEQEEIIRRRTSTQKLSLKEIKQMCYLSKIIDEALRKASISTCIFREAKMDVEMNGYLVPKGWKVLVWGRAVHMDPETHADPERFLPSRWDNQKLKPGSFIPFGAGSRKCPGADFAKLEISIFLHYLVLNYKMEQQDPGCPSIYVPLPRPRDNCLAKITKLP